MDWKNNLGIVSIVVAIVWILAAPDNYTGYFIGLFAVTYDFFFAKL